MPDRYEDLRAALPGATPGPWFVVPMPWDEDASLVYAGSEDPHAGAFVAVTDQEYEDGSDRPQFDAAYIAAADPTTVRALLDERDRYRVALEEIAALAEVAYHGQECVCGHKPMFCHRVNADRWCGGTTSPAIWRARAALEQREGGLMSDGTMQGRRVAEGTKPWDFEPGDYGLVRLGTFYNEPTWYCRAPEADRMDTGNLARHEVTEHEDGTITVSPSILIYPHGDSPGWHGWLERGVWRSV